MTIVDREEIEYLLGRSCSVFSSQQRALETCLEALGLPTYGTAVTVPVIAPSWVISAILRSGGTPVLLDINRNNLEYNLTDLQDIINDQEELVILYFSPFGLKPSNEFLNIAKDKISILIQPSFSVLQEAYINEFVFAVCDMQFSITPAGGILYSKYQDTKSTILRIRDGILGIGDYYPEELASKFKNYYKFGLNKFTEKVILDLKSVLADKNITILSETNIDWLPILVENAQKTLVNLKDLGIVCKVDLRPLHTFSEIGQRYQVPPSYPEAEKLYNKVLSLQISNNTLNKIKGISI